MSLQKQRPTGLNGLSAGDKKNTGKSAITCRFEAPPNKVLASKHPLLATESEKA